MPSRHGAASKLLNFVDLIFGLIIVLAMARGWSRGLLSTIATYTAPVLGFMIAADMSDPVRDWLATSIEAPDIALDALAPLVVFLVVVAIVRFLAAILARLLGVGLSLPGRVLGAAASGAVLAVLIGAGVLLVDEVNPGSGRAARETGAQAPAQDADPLRDFVMDVDRQLDESLLAPQLAALAAATWREVSGKDPAEFVSQEIEAARGKATEAVQQNAVEAIQRNAADAVPRSAADASRQDPAGQAAVAPPAGDASKKPGGDPAQ